MWLFYINQESIDIGVNIADGIALQETTDSKGIRNHTYCHAQATLLIMILIIQCRQHLVTMHVVVHGLIPSHATHNAMARAIHRHSYLWRNASEDVGVRWCQSSLALAIIEHSIHVQTPLKLLRTEGEC